MNDFENKKKVKSSDMTKDFTYFAGKNPVEEDLIKSESRYRGLVELAVDGILLGSHEGVVIEANDCICQIFGRARSEIIGKHISRLNFKPESVQKYPFQFQLLQQGETVISERTIVKPNGTEVEVEMRTKMMPDGTYQSIYRDITRRKKYESEIKQHSLEMESINSELNNSKLLLESVLLQKNLLIEELTETKYRLEKINLEKDKLFSIIAHDLRSPFTGFIGLTALMSDENTKFTVEEMQNIAHSLRNSASNLFKLLENLLQWSRMQRGYIENQLESLNFKTLVDANIELQNSAVRQKDIEIVTCIDDDISIQSDAMMLNTIIRNLLSNAIKFTPRGGRIEIGVEVVPPKDFGSSAKYIQIYFKDSGIGMNDDSIEKLFRIDQKVSTPGTDNEPSTGLGLLLCKEFVENLGGKIWVESRENHGSTFYFTLPADSQNG